MNPVPLPPLALNVRVPRGDTVGDDGVTARLPPTEIDTLALLPSASVTLTMSTEFAVPPAT